MHYDHTIKALASLIKGALMHYDHTTKAIASIIIGILMLTNFLMVACIGFQFIPILDNPDSLPGFLYRDLFHFIPFLSLVLIIWGVTGIRRELWVRRFEKKIRI